MIQPRRKPEEIEYLKGNENTDSKSDWNGPGKDRADMSCDSCPVDAAIGKILRLFRKN